jgi:uncharacterized membrane protein YjfL (UPF0719 family)
MELGTMANTDNVLKLDRKVTRNPRGVSKVKRAIKKPNTHAKLALAGTTLAVLTASLYDLIGGIQTLTDCPTWQAWAMALGIDALFMATEYCVLTTAEPEKIKRYADPLITLTLAMSAGLNALNLCHGQLDLDHSGAIAFGIVLPIVIYLATHILAKMK